MSLGIRILTTVNVWAFRITHGVLGSSLAGQSVLLLHTLGRRSGNVRLTPVNYYLDGNNYILVASNWGNDNNPAWYHNLIAHPEVAVEIGAEQFKAKAVVTKGEERERLFNAQAGQMPMFNEYRNKTTRQIPVIALERVK